MKKIGLTGVMGAGKSSVIQILKEEGITVIDCDAVNASLLEKGEAGYKELLKSFGTSIVDTKGEIDKQKMSTLIFTDRKKKQQAEELLHPLIRERIEQELQKHREEAFVVVEVPLLFEVEWEVFFDEVWVVACEEELLLSRLEKYRHVSRQEALRRLAAQIPQEEKIKRATVVFYNNGDKENLKHEICAILKKRKETLA